MRRQEPTHQNVNSDCRQTILTLHGNTHNRKRSLHFCEFHRLRVENINYSNKKSVLLIRTVRIVWQSKCNTLFFESQIYLCSCDYKYIKNSVFIFFAPSVLLTYARLCGIIYYI